MRIKRLFLIVPVLILIIGAVAITGYYVASRTHQSLTNTLLKLKLPLFFGGLITVLVIGAVIFGYFLGTKPPRNLVSRVLELKRPLFVGGLFIIFVIVAGFSGYKLGNQTVKSVAATPLQTTSTSTSTGVGIPSRNVLSVNYTVKKPIFTNKMLGVNFVNWEHGWGKPYPNEVKGLAMALKAAHVGIIRYAGGNWSNSVAWDRTSARTPYTGWPDPKNGPYWFSYNSAEIDSVAQLAHDIGAEVMIEVNISTSDPAMWADMVKYTNVEHSYGFKYWELGNEFDLDQGKSAPNPDEYAARVKLYLDAMMDIDPGIKITTAAAASPYEATRAGYNDNITDLSQYLTKSYAIVSSKGRKIQALTYHWYQACNSTEITDLQRYAWPGLAENSWRNNFSRKQADLLPGRIITELTKGTIPQGISELNFDSCNFDNPLNGNFLNALWTSDVIGRLAYNGVDFATRWQGYGTQAFSLLYADEASKPTHLYARPAYYTYLMYANYFGDQMVESTTNDNSRLSIWAARDSADPSKLKLIVTNLSDTDITTQIQIPGFSSRTAQVYQMKSANPTDSSPASLTAAVTINDTSIDLSDVVSSIASIKPQTLAVAGAFPDYTFSAYSATAIILTGDFGPILTPDPRATPPPTIAFLPTPTPLPTPEFKVTTNLPKNEVKPGQAISFTTTVTVNKAAAKVLVDTEVYCSADNVNWSKDFQTTRDDQTFELNQARTYDETFEVPASHAKGKCFIKVGIFSPGWKKQLGFFDTGSFDIQ